MTELLSYWLVFFVVTAQAIMVVSFVTWIAGLITAVSYGLMSHAIIPMCAAILTAICYLVR